MLLGALKIAPALCAGNTLMLKAAEDAPLGVLMMAEICQEFLPPGVLNVVTGLGWEFLLEGVLDSFTQRKNVTVNLMVPAASRPRSDVPAAGRRGVVPPCRPAMQRKRPKSRSEASGEPEHHLIRGVKVASPKIIVGAFEGPCFRSACA